MGEDKNVFLTIMRNDTENAESEIDIDLRTIAKYVRRFFALWLCLAVALGCLSGAVSLLSQNILDERTAKAMILLPNSPYDVTKIKSPAVVGEALNEMRLDALDMEMYRDAVEIGGVIPTSSYEQLSMYYDLLNKNAGNNLDVIQSLLNTKYSTDRYIISFHYMDANLSRKDGLSFLNTLLRSYQRYCMKAYNSNLSMGNPLSAINYREYDYAEAADIFSTTLENITAYLSSLENLAGSFRSTATGLTAQDLRRTASLLRDIDLDRLSSYIVIHSVSDNDAETEISYYQWRIEELERQRNIQRTRFNSLTDSINNYRKDDILIIAGVNGASMTANPVDTNANYDTMIQEKLDAQSAIASYTRSISYYEKVIEGFQDAESSKAEDIEFVRGYMESLNEKLNALIRNITLTANEYYETVAFSNEVRILIPSTAEKPPLITRATVKILVILEGLLFLGYLGFACVKGIAESNPSQKKETDKPDTVTA